MTVDEDTPLIEGRPLMQLCAAFCRPLRKEEATCAEQYPVKPSCCTACSKRCNPGHSYAGDMQEGMQKIRMAQMPVDVTNIASFRFGKNTGRRTYSCGIALGVLRPPQGLNEGQGSVVGLRAGQITSDGAIARVEKADQAIHHLHNVPHSTLPSQKYVAERMANIDQCLVWVSAQRRNKKTGESGLQSCNC